KAPSRPPTSGAYAILPTAPKWSARFRSIPSHCSTDGRLRSRASQLTCTRLLGQVGHAHRHGDEHDGGRDARELREQHEGPTGEADEREADDRNHRCAAAHDGTPT